jgi:hypothetical protein
MPRSARGLAHRLEPADPSCRGGNGAGVGTSHGAMRP